MMRLRLPIVVLAAFALTSGTAGGLQGERASGHGTDSFGGDFHFNAHGTGTGDDAQGHMTYVYPSGRRFAGYVTCMRITGNVATIAGVLTHDSDGAGAGSEFNLFLNDEGRRDGTDDFHFSIFAPAPPPICLDPSSYEFEENIQRGDVTVSG